MNLEKQAILLTSARTESGLSLRQVERDTNISLSRLQRLESGKYPLTLPECYMLDTYYNMDIYSSLRDGSEAKALSDLREAREERNKHLAAEWGRQIVDLEMNTPSGFNFDRARRLLSDKWMRDLTFYPEKDAMFFWNLTDEEALAWYTKYKNDLYK